MSIETTKTCTACDETKHDSADPIDKAKEFLTFATQFHIGAREGITANTEMAQAFAQLAIAEELKGVRQVLVAMHTGAAVDSVEASEELF